MPRADTTRHSPVMSSPVPRTTLSARTLSDSSNTPGAVSVATRLTGESHALTALSAASRPGVPSLPGATCCSHPPPWPGSLSVPPVATHSHRPPAWPTWS